MNLNTLSYDELIKHAEDVLVAVRYRAYQEGYKQGRADEAFDALDEYFGEVPGLTRDEIIEMAKEDVKGMFKDGYNGVGKVVRIPGEGHCKVEFVVNREKRTVVALISYAYVGTGIVRHKGFAKCAPDDCFNVHIGKAIALRRALGLEVPEEYLNAPQPTEIRVGDVILRKGAYPESNGLRTVTSSYGSGGTTYYLTKEGDGTTHISNVVRVVDDSGRN